MKIKLLNSNGYKDRVFSAIRFPIVVDAKRCNSGIERGFYTVIHAELEKHGLHVDPALEDVKHDHDHGFLFSPCQIEELDQ